MMTSLNGNIFRVTGHLCGEFTGPGEFPTQRPVTQSFDVFFDLRPNKGVVTCAVCPESAWLVTFLIGNISTGVVTLSALRCGASSESGQKVAAAPLSKTAAAAAAAKTWFVKHPVDYVLHNRFPWKRNGRRRSMWPPYSLRRNLSAAACRQCDRSLNSWVNTREGGDLRCRRAHYDVIVMIHTKPWGPGAHFTNEFFHRISNSMENFF